MCGICGLVAPGRAEAVRPAAERMSAALRHRGPDDAGLHADGPAVLAARRLAIIDLERGAQPALGEDGAVAVVQNGEIYNHAELRAELERAGHRFRSRHSDTEVLAHLYEEEGDAFVSRLRGMFAIAVWDARRRRLVLARDAFGIKPLLHARTPDGLAFASELTALRLAPGFDDRLDPDALDAYLAFNAIPAPLTIFRGARKLPPGHVLTWEDGVVELRRWTRPRPADAGATRTEPLEALAAEARERLRDSVRAHLVSDVPVGVLLSGGVDSSALAALATAEGGRLSSFSVGFAERTFDETPLARLVAGRLGTDHHELRISPELAAETMPGLAQAFDEPFADSSALPTFLVSRLAAEHVKVVLSGEGGDELFGGYETYVAGLLAQRFGPLAARLRPLAERLPSRTTRVSLDYRAKRFTRAAALPPLERHHAFKEIFAPETRRALTGGAGADPLGLLRDRFAETAGAPLLARLQDVDLGIYLPDDLLVKTDRMSMANSLEARVPFLDPAVAGLALALPTRLKVQGTRKKILLRAAVAPLVPAELLRAPKRGFSIPAAAWLRGPLLPLAREVLSPATLRAHGVIDAAVAGSVLERHATGAEDLSRQLWGLMSLSLWWERHGRAAGARVAA